MPNEPERLVPARYIGANRIHRSKLQGPGYDGNGQRRRTLAIEAGDVLMMPEREILGQTLLFDPHNVHAPLDLGAGKRIKPEHVGLSDEELEMRGYQFHGGRSDFELVVSMPPVEATLDVVPDQAPVKKRG